MQEKECHRPDHQKCTKTNLKVASLWISHDRNSIEFQFSTSSLENDLLLLIHQVKKTYK